MTGDAQAVPTSDMQGGLALDVSGEPAHVPEVAGANGRATRTFRSKLLHRMQHRHFWLLNIVPLAATVVGVLLVPVWPPSVLDLAATGALWAVTLFCIVAGFHRYFSHRSFVAQPSVRAFLQIGGLMAGQGSLISWVALHRRHHELSDMSGDPHSPRPAGRGLGALLLGLLHSQLLWMYEHPYPNVNVYARELIRDRRVMLLDRHYFHFVVAGVVAPGLLAFALEGSVPAAMRAVLWGGLIRIFLVGNTIGAVNSLLHTFGERRFRTRDNSRNSRLMALLTFGDSFHNNHHAFPSSAAAGLAWNEPDPAFWVIRIWAALGLTSELKVPTRRQIVLRERGLHMSNNTASMAAVSKETIAGHIRAEIARIVGVAAAAISTSDDLDRLGLNSSSIVALVGDLEDHYKVQLSPMLFFEHSTIDAVASALSTQLTGTGATAEEAAQ